MKIVIDAGFASDLHSKGPQIFSTPLQNLPGDAHWQSSDSIVFDRLSSPSSRLGRERRQNRFGYASLDTFNSDGANTFATMGLDSLRTAAIEVLPFDRWQDSWLGRLAPLIAGTIGNPQEEHIEVTSISYSAIRSSWERENANGGIQCRQQRAD